MAKIDFNIAPAGKTGDAAVYQFRGDITTSHGRMLHTFFDGLPAAGVKQAVIDMSGVKYMASIGLGELACGYNLLRGTGGGLALACPTPRVRELLKLSRMDTVLIVRDTVADAATTLAAPPAG